MVKECVRRWLEAREAEQRIIDGGGTDHEILGAITGLPPEAFAFVEEQRATDVLAAKIKRYWNSVPPDRRPAFMTMRQFQALFGGEGIGAWQIGNALRQIGWRSSRRAWKENAPRCRTWMPPVEL